MTFNKLRSINLYQILIFLILGAISFQLVWSDQYLAYLQPQFSVLVILSGVLFILFAVSLIFGKGPVPHQDTAGFLPGIIILLPLLFLINSKGSSLGSGAFENRVLDSNIVQNNLNEAVEENPISVEQLMSQSLTDRDGQPPVSYEQADINELLNNAGQFRNRPVMIKGVIQELPGVEWADAVIYRFFITCCAADARPLGVYIPSLGFQKFEKGDWVEVKGSYRIATVGSKIVPTIHPDSVQKIPTPPVNQQYLYFGN